MPADPQKLADTQAWLVKAQRDLLVAEQLLVHEHPLLDAVGYHCQQAGEEALKGFLFWHDTPFRKTHNLEELLAQCVTIDATLSVLEETASFLTPFATAFRYPGDLLEPPLDEAQKAYNHAKLLIAEIAKRLPGEMNSLPASPSR